MKRLVGSDCGVYTFNPAAKTITLTGLPLLALENLLVITNVATGVMLYNFADATLGATIDNNVIALEYDTTLMDPADRLQIWVDVVADHRVDGELYPIKEDFVVDTNMAGVFGSNPLVVDDGVKTAIAHRERPLVVGNLMGANSEVRADCSGMNTAAIQISGTWAGTIFFFGSVDGGDFQPLNTETLPGTGNTSSTPQVTATTASGIYRANCAGLKYVIVRFTTATSGQPRVSIRCSTARSGPTSPSIVYDGYAAASFGGSALYTPAHTELRQFPSAPSISPTQPTSYVEPKLANLPQRFRRLRVETGGSESLPFAQEPYTNRQLMAYPELLSKIEELLLQQQLTNILLAQAFNLQLPSGMDKIIK